MRQSFKTNTVQGFCVDAIRSNVTNIDLVGVEAIRIDESVGYTATFENPADNGSATLPEGVTVISPHMETLVLDEPRTVEIMRA